MLEKKWDGELREVEAQVEGISVFAGGGWFISQNECKEFARDQIPYGQFQWFAFIVIYLQFVTGEKVSTAESQRDKLHTSKVRKNKDQFIIISAFEADINPIMGRMGEVKESSTPLTSVRMPYLWNYHDRFRIVYPRASESLHNKIIKLQAQINWEFQIHMESRLMVSKFLGKCGVFWSEMEVEVGDFRLRLVTTMYGETALSEGRP